MNFTCLSKIQEGNVWFLKSLRENMRQRKYKGKVEKKKMKKNKN